MPCSLNDENFTRNRTLLNTSIEYFSPKRMKMEEKPNNQISIPPKYSVINTNIIYDINSVADSAKYGSVCNSYVYISDGIWFGGQINGCVLCENRI